MKMVVGLGNPGRKYISTRHNVGFEVIAELARRFDAGRPRAKFDGEFAETVLQNKKILLVCPLTFMNLSGQCVQAAMDFYKIQLDDLLVVCDDINLDLARIRIKAAGSAGGQKGLDDIIRRLGTQAIGRLRLGVGRVPPNWDASDYVLGKFSSEEKVEIEKAIRQSADAVEHWVGFGIQSAMNRFNADPNKPEKTVPNESKTSGGSRASEPEARGAKENQTETNNKS
jgi:PTH1 family peptidyl-tRNA hydrolase